MNMQEEIQSGQVVYATHIIETGRPLAHYFLILRSEEGPSGRRYAAAYGTSRQVCSDSELDHEFVIRDEREMDRAGLVKATRFDLKRKMTLLPEDIIRITGSGIATGKMKRRLYKAMLAAL